MSEPEKSRSAPSEVEARPTRTTDMVHVNTKLAILNIALSAIAQGVIEIDEGFCKVVPSSRTYLGMKTLVDYSQEIKKAFERNDVDDLLTNYRQLLNAAIDAASFFSKHELVGKEANEVYFKLRDAIAKAETVMR